MSLFSGIGNFFKSAFNAVKSFAGSGLGQTLLGAVGNLVAPGIGGAIAKVAGGILSSGKLNLQSIIKAGIGAFGGLTNKFGLGSLTNGLSAALKSPSGLGGIASTIGNLFKGGKLNLGNVASVAGQLLSGTSLGTKINDIVGKASQFLGVGKKIAGDAQSVLGSISNLLGNFGVNTSGLSNVSNSLAGVLGAAQKIQNIFSSITGALNPQSDPMMLRA